MLRNASTEHKTKDGQDKGFMFKRNFQAKLSETELQINDGVGYRSPCVSLQQYQGSTSPAGQGRSVREFEEQMATLRKENFNLKLRLYFIEESIPGYQKNNSPDNQETIMKQLIDAKVEMEILRKDIQEKQDVLKEAAQAINQMENIQRDTEAKSQALIDELKQKLHYLEIERDMEKSNNGELMNDLLGRSDISENLNAIQRIRELEGMIKISEEKVVNFQNEITKLDEILTKRDETITEYEDKVKELVFQNAELLESLESKEMAIANAERNLQGLRRSNADLKEDNQNLIETINATQDNFRKEMSNMQICERQMRDQQETLSKMQSTISIKTANTARLLERIQDYEKMVTKMNFERNLAKRENRFFRAIIGKLQRNKNECYMIEKEEIFQQIGCEYDEKPVDANKHYDSSYLELKARGDFHGEYKLKQKLCVNISNSALFNAPMAGAKRRETQADQEGAVDFRDNCMHECCCCDIDSDAEPEIPVRYTFSDGSLFAPGTSKTNSCSSLQANFSSSSIFASNREPPVEKDQRRNKYSSVDGVRYVYSKFGNFQ